MQLTNDELKEITDLAKKQIELQDQIAQMEQELSRLNDRLNKVRGELLPQAMDRVGMKKFMTQDGSSITIKDEIFASIRNGKIDQAAAWLDGIGCGDVLKDEVNVKFARGQASIARSILALAEQLGVSAIEKLSVHPQTLKALVREQRAKGRDFPEEIFAIHDAQKAIIIKGGTK